MSSTDPSAGAPQGVPAEIILARWSDRFFAWLIDFIIVNIAVWVILGATMAPFMFYGLGPMMQDPGRFDGPGRWFDNATGPLSYITTSLFFFAYWTFFEFTKGQSIGKMALKIKTVNVSGKKPELKEVMIESFGKSFLLVIDVILGWIFTNEKRQRIFNRASSTIVVKIKEEKTPDVQYKKD